MFARDFPPDSEIDEVSELHARLAEYDGYVAGIANSTLDGHHPEVPDFDRKLLRDAKEMLERRPEAADELVQYIARLAVLERILELGRIHR